jgi:signal transduction histidine kinase
MVNLPLQKVIGTPFKDYIDDPGKKLVEAMLTGRDVDYLKEEIYINASDGKKIPALMTANAWRLDDLYVLGIILTDLTLQIENKERLKRRSRQLEEKNNELESANNELAFQFEEKEKRAAELVIANKELAFQNKEKDKRAAELDIANHELAFQNAEKEKRAAELVIANKELAFQNKEKDKRAAELDIANQELAFQNTEKEKRAAELVIANKELAFQNKEKDKRAAELDIANYELAFQNSEKEKRAAELIITNEELKHLLELNADKDRFISILAHDLRSPFNSILGFLSLLSEKIRSYSIDEIEEYIGMINQSAQSTFDLLEELISWTMSQSGKLPYEPEKLIFTDVCEEVIENLLPIANAKNISLNYYVTELITVFADIHMLKTILRNLISNAIKFTNYGGKIGIYAEKKGSDITISVSDNGIGIEQETINMLFDTSTTLTTRGTDNESGTGLGLILCKEFVEKHGSKIRVESKEGEGSSFYFTLLAEKPLDTTIPK